MILARRTSFFAVRRTTAAFSTETANLTRQHSTRQKEAVTSSSQDFIVEDLTDPRITVHFSTKNKPGALEEALRVFWKHDINMTRIVSEPSKNNAQDYDFTIDFEGTAADATTQTLLQDLHTTCHNVDFLEPKVVPWFPTSLNDLDLCVQQTLDAGDDLESDHPGFNDEEYRNRRKEITNWANSFKFGDPIPRINYTDSEVKTWGSVLTKLRGMFNQYACKEYLEIFPLIEKHCGARVDNIPQICDISDFLRETTGFQMRPVAGLLSARNFLNGLAFKTFFSTQYIRHHSMPLYTPEPDICHELLGHAPMFADPDFAEFSHRIGLASLGASDSDIKRLATCYWFTVEFGLLMENGERKAFGAGLLSSFGELEYSCSPTRPAGGVDEFPNYLPWEPDVASDLEYPITTYQPTYFVAENLQDAKERMRSFCDNDINKPFGVRYKHYSNTIEVDRSVVRGPPPEGDECKDSFIMP